MAQQPLNNKISIVNSDGTPNQYFIRLLQERGITLDGKISAAEAQALIDAWAAARDIIAGDGLSGGGNLSSDVTIDLDAGLGDLNDVDFSTPPTDLQVLVYDAASSTWIPANQSGGGGSGGLTHFSIPFFRGNAGTSFGSGNFGGRSIVVPTDGTISHVAFYVVTANGSSVVTPAIYSNTSTGTVGTLLAQGPSVTGVPVGVNILPLTTPLTVTKGTVLWIGAQVLTSSLNLGSVNASDTMFFGSTGALPSTAPGASYGGAGSMCFWAYGTQASGGGGGGGTGTVTSIDVTTSVPGLSTSGGPVTTSGTVSISLTSPSALKTALGLGTMADETASDYSKTVDFATVAFSADYNDLTNTPVYPPYLNDLLDISGTGDYIVVAGGASIFSWN